MVGKRFGSLMVQSFSHVHGGHAMWVCRCDCGIESVKRGSHLTAGDTINCGCVARQKSSVRLKEYATSERHLGVGNPSWKGKDAGYTSFHQYLLRHFKKKKACEHCAVAEKKLDWALKRGRKYSRDPDDYLCLCRSCHLKYDYTKARRANVSKSLLGKKRGAYNV